MRWQADDAGVTYRKLRSRHWSSIDIGMRADIENPAAEVFLEIVRPVLKQGGSMRD
jgi:hypothetical protein